MQVCTPLITKIFSVIKYRGETLSIIYKPRIPIDKRAGWSKALAISLSVLIGQSDMIEYGKDNAKTGWQPDRRRHGLTVQTQCRVRGAERINQSE